MMKSVKITFYKFLQIKKGKQSRFFNKYLASFALGSISALAFAPYYWFVLAIVAFSSLFLILDKCRNNKESFWIGWFFGFGYFVFGLYWFSVALLTDFPKFVWLIPFALSLIPAILAIYIGLITLVTNLIANLLSLNKPKKLLILALGWMTFEWFQLYLFADLFIGFPWNLMGYTLGFSLELMQAASVVGVFGLGLLAIVFYTAPALFFDFKGDKLIFKINKENKLILLLLLTLLVLIWIYGHYRLANSQIEFVDNGNLRIVQSSITQEEKRNAQTRFEAFYRNIELTKSPGFEKINYVIWSESAIPYIINKNNNKLLTTLSQAVPKDGFLVSGALRAEYSNDQPAKINKIWNSVFVIDQYAQIVAVYDKHHLVPFGEYIPFQELVPFISKITEGNIGFSAGEGAKTIRLNDNLPSFSPLICYEVIFPNKIIDVNDPPDFLINITNDIWFGNSTQPYQHFDMARFRAIEYGIPLVRVANTGISALIDPYGRIVDRLDLNRKGIFDVKLMKNLPQTIYSKYGTL